MISRLFQNILPNNLLTSLRLLSKMNNINSLEPNRSTIIELINKSEYLVFSKSTCPFCKKVKDFFDGKGISYSLVELDQIEKGTQIQNILYTLTAQKTVPSIFNNGSFIGGSSDLFEMVNLNHWDLFVNNTKELKKLKETPIEGNFDFDLAVIGGGSGGLACAKKAADYGKKTIIFDFVKPSPPGSVWGLGGTCVNVGCIPKKLFHQCSIVGETLHTSNSYGWENNGSLNHNWETLVTNIQTHIKGLNFGYRASLNKKGVKYCNAYAVIKNPHLIEATDKNGVVTSYRPKFIVVATGERPYYPDLEGAKECCITSDDVFSLPKPPGKTLIIGASYVALECAGALHGMGIDVTVMVRSILLRGFDQEIANKIGEYMLKKKIKFLNKCVPKKFEKLQQELLNIAVTYENLEDHSIVTDNYDTVLLAIGRESCTKNIGLTEIGVKLDSKNRVIGLNGGEMTTVSSVFALGDILADVPQLTPMAIKAGDWLASRLFTNEIFDKCDYSLVPTTVFTPLEYGSIGLSEEDAILKYGDAVEIYHNYVPYLESTLIEESDPQDYYAKLICLASQNNKIIGLHILCSNAGEITQGYALGMKMGATYKDMSHLVGIHPTCAEVFTTMKTTKRSGNEIEAGGC